MAEIKAQERMIAQPSAPDLSGAGAAYGGINQVIQTASKVVGNYVKAQDNLETSYVFSEYSNALNAMLQDATQPANLVNQNGGTAFERYQNDAYQLVEEAVAQTPKGFQEETRLKLQGLMDVNTLKVRGAYQNDLEARNRSSVNAMLKESMLTMSDAIRTGDMITYEQSKLQALSLADSAMNSNMMSPSEVAAFDLQLRDSEIQAQYFKLGKEASLASPKRVAEIQEQFAKDVDGLSPHEADAAIQAFNASSNQTTGLLAGQRQRRADELLSQAETKKFELESARLNGSPEEIEIATKAYNRLLDEARSMEYIGAQEKVAAQNAEKRATRTEYVRREVENIEAEIAKKKVALAQFAQGGNQERAKQIEQEIETLNKRLVSLHAISKKDAFNEKLGVQQSAIEARYFQRGMNDANAPPGTVEAQKEKFATEFLEDDLTKANQILAIQAYIQGANFNNNLNQEQRTLNFADVSNAIASGTITNPAQLLDYDLSALQAKQAEGAIIKQQSKSNAAGAKLTYALRAVSAGGGMQNLLTPKEKSAAYASLAETKRENKVNETGDTDYQLSNEDTVSLIKQMNTDIPWVTERLNYALTKADPDKEAQSIEGALGLSRVLAAEAPNTLRALDSKTRSIMNMANSAILHGQNVDIANAITQARAAANPEEPAQQQRAARWTGTTEKDKQKLYKQVFSDDPQTNPDTYGEFKNQMELFNQDVDSLSQAVESTRQVMEPLYGQDPFFEKDKNGYLPSSAAVPYSQVGRWYSNQVFLDLYGLTQRQANSDIDINERLEWIYGELPQKITEEDMMNKDVYSLQGGRGLGVTYSEPLRAKYKGNVVDVYYEADRTSRIDDEGRVKYVFYTKNPDTGLKSYILDPKSQDGTGWYTTRIKPLKEFLPGVYEKMNSETLSQAARKSEERQRGFFSRLAQSASPALAESMAEAKRAKVDEIKADLKKSQETFVVGGQ